MSYTTILWLLLIYGFGAWSYLLSSGGLLAVPQAQMKWEKEKTPENARALINAKRLRRGAFFWPIALPFLLWDALKAIPEQIRAYKADKPRQAQLGFDPDSL